MPTRLYLPDLSLAEVTPAFDGAWGATAEASRKKLALLKGNSPLAIGTVIGPTWSGSELAGDSALDRQYISPPLAAQTISGTVKGQLLVREHALADNVDQIHVAIKVISNDGTSVRGTLLSKGSFASTAEFLESGYRNKKIADGDSLTSVAALAGDRLLIELGYSASTNHSSPEGSAKWGESGTDLPEDETQTTDGVPWLEFSGPVVFRSEFTTLTSGQSSTNATSYATASITPTAGRLLLAIIENGDDSAPSEDPSSLSGNGLTWEFLDSVSHGGGFNRFGVWFALTGAAPSAGAVTINFAATKANCVWQIIEVAGIDDVSPIIQSDSAVGTSTTPSVTLGAFSHADNYTFFAVWKSGSGGGTDDIQVDSGYVKIGEQPLSESGWESEIGAVGRYNNDTTVTCTLSGSVAWVAIAIELGARFLSAGGAMPLRPRPIQYLLAR